MVASTKTVGMGKAYVKYLVKRKELSEQLDVNSEGKVTPRQRPRF